MFNDEIVIATSGNDEETLKENKKIVSINRNEPNITYKANFILDQNKFNKDIEEYTYTNTQIDNNNFKKESNNMDTDFNKYKEKKNQKEIQRNNFIIKKEQNIQSVGQETEYIEDDSIFYLIKVVNFLLLMMNSMRIVVQVNLQV